MRQNDFYSKVYKAVMKIPKGRVATYYQIADLCGNLRASRAVGNALHKNPRHGIIPCHRVVNKDGRLSKNFAFGGIEGQKSLLQSENVFVDQDYKVNLLKYKWDL